MKNVLAIAILAGVFAFVWFSFVKPKETVKPIVEPPVLPKRPLGLIGSIYTNPVPVSSGILSGPCAGLTGSLRDLCLGTKDNSNGIPTNSNSVRIGV